MKVRDVNQAVETVQALDEQRRETFKKEYRDTKDSDYSFESTRQIISEERDALADLSDAIEAEQHNIDEIIDNTDFFTVDQAIQHRDQTISKINNRNEQLRRFHDAMSRALTIIESNLDALEKEGGNTAIDEDPTSHLEEAQAALQDHNKAVSGLEDNLKILNAYLI